MRIEAAFEIDTTMDCNGFSADEVIKDEFLKALRGAIRKRVQELVAARESDLKKQVEAAAGLIFSQLHGMTLEEARSFVKGIYQK